MNEHKDVELSRGDECQSNADSAGAEPCAETTGGEEFRLVIKKLEMPVRPRGVLAE